MLVAKRDDALVVVWLERSKLEVRHERLPRVISVEEDMGTDRGRKLIADPFCGLYRIAKRCRQFQHGPFHDPDEEILFRAVVVIEGGHLDPDSARQVPHRRTEIPLLPEKVDGCLVDLSFTITRPLALASAAHRSGALRKLSDQRSPRDQARNLGPRPGT
ncbi:MAG: hypothetical protein WEE66_08160 [Actinomycetota bacterium]